MNQSFHWKRFWCEPDKQFQLDDSGYLLKPDGEYGKYFSPDIVDFETIQDTPCLVLLGEPGIGKTYAVRAEIEELEKKTSEKTDSVISIDLKSYGSEDLLHKVIFESEKWKHFLNGTHKNYLFLDSLDEIRLRIPHIANLIIEGLKAAPLDRLFLRIACRTAEWPWSFTDGLKKLWSEDRVKTYELLPLRDMDVIEAAKQVGINADKFMEAIAEKKAGPLAAKPITLDFLLNLYKKDGGFPSSQFELYRKGCLYLCEEPSKERREKGNIDKRYVGYFSAEQRLAVASRIAATLMYANKFAVCQEIVGEVRPENCVSIKELVGGKEKSSIIFDITEEPL